MALAPSGVNQADMVSAGERRRNMGFARQDAIDGVNKRRELHTLLAKQSSNPNNYASAKLASRLLSTPPRRSTFDRWEIGFWELECRFFGGDSSGSSSLSTVDEKRRHYGQSVSSRTSQMSTDSGFYNMRFSRDSHNSKKKKFLDQF